MSYLSRRSLELANPVDRGQGLQMINVLPADQMGYRPIKAGDHTLVTQFIEEGIVLEGKDFPATIYTSSIRGSGAVDDSPAFSLTL